VDTLLFNGLTADLTTSTDVLKLSNTAALTVNSTDFTQRVALAVRSDFGAATLTSTTGSLLNLTDSAKATFQAAIAEVAGFFGLAKLNTNTDILRLAKTSILVANGADMSLPALEVNGFFAGAELSSTNGSLLYMTDTAKATFNGAPGSPSMAYVTDSSGAAPGALLQTASDVIKLAGKVTLTVNGTGPAILVEETGGGPGTATLMSGGGVLNASGGATATFAGSLVLVDPPPATAQIVPGATLIQASGGSTIAINGNGGASAAIAVTQGASQSDPVIKLLAGGSLLSNNASTVTTGGTLAALDGDIWTSGYLVAQTGGTTTIGNLASGDILDVMNSSNTASTVPVCALGPASCVGGLLTMNGGTFKATGSGVNLVDLATFNAALPLINAINKSNITIGSTPNANAGDAVVRLSDAATLSGNTFSATVLDPAKGTVYLDNSTMTVNGSLYNLLGSTNGMNVATVIGHLTALRGGSILTVNSPALIQLFGNSSFTLSGAFVAFGVGGGTLKITGDVNVACGACPFSVNSFYGFPIVLTNGANISQVTVNPGFVAKTGVGTVSIAPNAGYVRLDGINTSLTLNPHP
jgi:hypothetical protein